MPWDNLRVKGAQRLGRAMFICVSLSYVVACGGSSGPPSQSPAPTTPTTPPTTTTITGRERIGWTQPADTIANIAFLLYIDGVSTEVNASCQPGSAASTFDCDAPLPPMGNGVHALQLAAAARDGSTLLEGAKSETLTVTVNSAAATTSGTMALGQNRSGTRDATATAADPDSRNPTDATSCGLSTWDEGHVTAWSSRGELSVISVATQAARSLTWGQDDLAAESWRLENVTRRVDSTGGKLYAVFMSSEDGTPIVHVARYREVGGALGERAVLVERRLSETPRSVSAGFGPDGFLYIAFASAVRRAEPAPFVMVVDPDVTSAGNYDPRLQSRAAIASAWGTDGRFWMVEPAGDDHYDVRAADSQGAAWQLTAPDPPIGLEGFGSPSKPQLAAFSASGPGWLLSNAAIAAAPQPVALGPSRQAMLISGTTAISCVASPQLALQYVSWPR